MTESLSTERARADAAARVRALDPLQSFIVQAPAGSGKTELLTQRYLRLLATVEHPEQILAITFTRKAAAEMRHRIVAALRAATEAEPKRAHERLTFELANEVLEADRRAGWRLAEHPSRLRIQTIDALNALLARRLPIVSGAGGALEPSDDPQPLYEAAATRLLEELSTSSPAAAHLRTLIEHLGNRIDLLVALLIGLLARRDQWLPTLIAASASDSLRASLEATLTEVVESHLRELCKTFDVRRRGEIWALANHAAENLLRDGGLDDRDMALLTASQNFDGLLDETVASAPAWALVAYVFLTDKDEPYRRIDKRHGFPKEHAAMKGRMMQMLAEIERNSRACEQLRLLRGLPSIAYPDAQWKVLEALLALLPLAVAQLQLVFQERGTADYVEGALRALQALGPPDEPTDLALAFDYSLRHILIDEFQDTSFAQLELLERLTAGWMPGDGRTLFCVGDPMQSVYRFRQAEVGLFLNLKERGLRHLPLESLTLSANFRSAADIVGWVNHTFPDVLAARDDAEQGAVRYSPSVAALASKGGKVHVHASFERDVADEARRVVDIVRRALARDRQSTVAILVANRSHIGGIGSELNRAGIAFEAVEIEQLRERPVVQDLLALTRALVHVGDRTAWLAVLRAPWCGLTLDDLYALAAQNPHATIHQLLTNDAALEALSVAGRDRLLHTRPALLKALQERGRSALRDRVEHTWNELLGPATALNAQDLEDAEAFFERIEALDVAGDLDDVARLEEQLDQLYATARGHTQARVEIMTMHKAKGLEFDTVILPALERGTRGQDRVLLRWARIAGLDPGLVLAPVSRSGAEVDSIYRWLERLETERARRERARLLYVAVTRTRKELHLLGSVKVKSTDDGPVLRSPPADSMLGMLWKEVESEFQASLALATQASLKFDSTETTQYLRRLPSNWRPVLVQTATNIVVEAPDVVDAERPIFEWVGETSRHIGTLVHRELERLARSAKLTDWRAARARLLLELAELGVPLDRLEGACDRVIDALDRTIHDARGRWVLGLAGNTYDAESEFALSGMLEGRVVEGVIDRTLIDEHGTRWIIDFKTSSHAGGGLEEFLANEELRYRPQLSWYARLMREFKPGEMVKAALYFPLLGIWREVAV